MQCNAKCVCFRLSVSALSVFLLGHMHADIKLDGYQTLGYLLEPASRSFESHMLNNSSAKVVEARNRRGKWKASDDLSIHLQNCKFSGLNLVAT